MTDNTAQSGAYSAKGSVRSRASFPLPDVSWDLGAPYWEGAAAGELRLPFCVACGAPNWYPKRSCGRCHHEVFTWRAVSGRGLLFSFSGVRHPFLPQYASMVPFVPALVTLDEVPGIRIVTRIVTGVGEVDASSLFCDAPVDVVFRPLRFDGVAGEVMAPLFVIRT